MVVHEQNPRVAKSRVPNALGAATCSRKRQKGMHTGRTQMNLAADDTFHAAISSLLELYAACFRLYSLDKIAITSAWRLPGFWAFATNEAF